MKWWNSHHQTQWNEWCLLDQNHKCKNKDCIHQCQVECDDSVPTWWRGVIAQGLMIQNTYTKMHNGRRSVAVIARNGMAYPQTLKKIPVVRVVAANCMSEAQMQPGMMDALDEVQGIQTPRMTTEQRQEKLCEKLDLSSLGSWPPDLVDFTHSLLVEYHNIFP